MNAYVTLLSTENYLKGVIALHKALLKVKSKYPFFCVLSQCVSPNIKKQLEKCGISCICLTNTVVKSDINSKGDIMEHWNFTFDKLQIWGLIQFEKLVFIDSDMLVLRNLDTLFSKEEFSAVQAGKSYPGNSDWDTLNSGIMVIRPDKDVEKELINLTQTVIEKFRNKNSSVGDQDVLHYYLPTWNSKPSLFLDEGYNIFANYLTYYILSLKYSLFNKNNSRKPIYIIHFVGKVKPWMKKSFKDRIQLIYMCMKNPFYIIAYWLYSKYF